MAKQTIYTIKGLSGVELSGENGKGMSYMKNMVIEEGIAKKRRGWRNLYNFRGYTYQPYAINGIYEYKGKEKSSLIIHADSYLYECSYDLKDISQIPLDSGVTLKNKKSTGQMHAGVLWLGGMGQLLIYDGTSVKNAFESDLSYIPVTAVGIGDINSGLEYEKNESPNLICSKRINKLRGVKNSDFMHKFLLDSKVAYGKPFSLTASFRVRKSTDTYDPYSTEYIGTSKGGQEVNTVVTVNFYTDSLTEKSINAVATPVDMYGDTINVGGANLSCRVTNGNELTLSFEAPTYQKDTDNISVTYVSKEGVDTQIDSIEAMAQISLKSGGSVMAVCCGTSKIYCAMEKDGCVYFPKNGAVTVGGETEKITALVPMAQSALAVYKRDSFYRLEVGDDGTRHEIFPSSDSYGSISSFVTKRIGYDCLSYNKHGVFLASDKSVEENTNTRLYTVSTPINRELSKLDLEDMDEAVACVHDGAYYLFVGGRVYIAGNDQEKEYEWWMFDNCDASYAASINGNIYMGRKNGDVAVFDSGYTDRQDYVLTDKENDFVIREASPTTVAFNYAIGVQDGTKISLDPHYLYLSECVYTKADNKIKVPSESFFDSYGYVDLWEGQEVLLIDSEGYQVYSGQLIDVDPCASTVFCGNLGLGESCRLSLYIKKDENTEYTVKTVGGVKTLFYGDRPATLKLTRVERVIVRRKRDIECELYTPVIDLGVNGDKTLCGIIFTPTADTRCKLRIGYETRRSAFSKELTIGSYMDFEGTDFKDFSFNPRFKKSIRINCLERNFDYIRLWVYSSSGRELGIDSISLIYS